MGGCERASFFFFGVNCWNFSSLLSVERRAFRVVGYCGVFFFWGSVLLLVVGSGALVFWQLLGGFGIAAQKNYAEEEHGGDDGV